MSASTDENTEVGRALRPTTVAVWDPLVRVFHWSLVAAFCVAWVTGGESEGVHTFMGYAIAGLVAFRVVWGIVGSRHARFADFLYAPATVIAFLKDTIALRARRYVGHNPAGGIMVVALLVGLVAIIATGIMMTTDAFWGVPWVRHAHRLAVDLTLLLIVAHLAGVALASYEHGENLVKAMFTGRKRAED